jgi:soluble lytic murein transglycosylase
MTMKQKLFFGLIALAAAAPELISRRHAGANDVVPQPTEAAVPSIQDTSDIGVAMARRGSALHDDGKYREAVARFDSAAQRMPHLADWLAVFAASSLSHVGDTVEVARRLGAVDSLLAHDWAWRTRARAFAKANARERALAAANAAARAGSASKRASALLFAAEMQRDLGRQADQRATLKRAIELAPYSDGGRDAARVLASFTSLTRAERLLAGRTLLRNGEPTRGIAVLRRYLEQEPDINKRAQIRYELGSALFSMDEYQAAERELQRVPVKHARAADARFLIGRAQYRRGNETAGMASFRRAINEYPSSQAATRALYFLGDLAQDDGRWADAARYFKQAAARGEKGGSEVALAAMRLGTLQYRQKDYAAAQKTFEGRRGEQAAFWLARTLEAQGKTDAARAQLEKVDANRSLSYYDARAAQLLQRDFLRDLPSGPAAPANPDARVARALERWTTLRDIGWNEAAAYELGRLKRSVAGNTSALYHIAEQLIANGHANAGIYTGRELLDKGESWNRRLLRIVYPLPFQDTIEREARRHGLDPFFVAALMRQESWFNPTAVSGAGAVGLMQVLPSTGRQLARGENIGTVTAETLKDPDINIRLGTKFLAELLRTWQSRTDAVLAAYNAGPTRMDRWRSFPEFADPDLFVERIPFAETRDYVRIVRVNTTIYHSLYGD